MCLAVHCGASVLLLHLRVMQPKIFLTILRYQQYEVLNLLSRKIQIADYHLDSSNWTYFSFSIYTKIAIYKWPKYNIH
jgi:hypothetical protein